MTREEAENFYRAQSVAAERFAEYDRKIRALVKDYPDEVTFLHDQLVVTPKPENVDAIEARLDEIWSTLLPRGRDETL